MVYETISELQADRDAIDQIAAILVDQRSDKSVLRKIEAVVKTVRPSTNG